MANELTPIGQSRPPSKLLARQGKSTSASNFTEGVTDSFPRLSIRGKAFWVRMGGKEVRAGLVDPQKGAILDLVLINSSRAMNKAYYAKAFGSGDNEMPDCWSLDAVRPDASIAKPVNDTCADCPKNAFNSSPSGRGGKACQDSKRLVVTTADQLGKPEPILLLMRLPQQSHKNMKAHIEKLARHGYVEPYASITRLSFDLEVEFPKVIFDFVEPLTDEEFEAAEELALSKKVNDMLKNPDFDNAASPTKPAPANDTETVQLRHQRRAPQQGLGDVGIGGGAPAEAPAPAKSIAAQDVPRETSEAEAWEDLGDGTELELSTGEVRVKAAVEVLDIDPNVVATKDGRYFHRLTKKFVDSPYKGAAAAPVTTPKPVEDDKPKRGRKPRAKVEEPDEAVAQKAEPEQPATHTNGTEPGERPKVVAASPKLEALLGGLVPRDDEA